MSAGREGGGMSEGRTRWERWHPIRAKRLRRCMEAGTHHPVLVDLGRSKLCMTCIEWTRDGR